MNALIIGSGNVESINLIERIAKISELLICADGGARYFYKAKIKPDVMLGDFDSIEPDLKKNYESAGIKIVKFPSHKDYTDMELALDYAIEKGATNIYIMGATGSRLDHTLSNIQLLHKLKDAGVKGVIINQNNFAFLISDHIELQRKDGFILSLIPATAKVEGITTKGLAYPLQDATMSMGTGLGISNEFISEKAEVTIKKGRLYVILSKD